MEQYNKNHDTNVPAKPIKQNDEETLPPTHPRLVRQNAMTKKEIQELQKTITLNK